MVRQTLKGVELDSSRRVELEDYIDVRGLDLGVVLGIIEANYCISWLLDCAPDLPLVLQELLPPL